MIFSRKLDRTPQSKISSYKMHTDGRAQLRIRIHTQMEHNNET